MEPYELKQVASCPSKKSRDLNLEEALTIVGFGRQQLMFAFVAGAAFLAAGIQNGITAFILPSLKCDMELTSSEMGLLNAVFLIGGIGSGLVWGTVVDLIGRKPVLYYGLLIDSILTLASAFSPNFYIFLAFRMMNGFVIGGPASIALIHVGELIPQSHRTRVLCYVGLTWAVSWVVSAGLGFIIIPLHLPWKSIIGVQFSTWRLLLVFVAAIDLGSALLYTIIEESPKFYLSVGEEDKALKVLANVYAGNTNQKPSDFPLISLGHLKTSSGTVDCPTKSIWTPLVVMVKQFKGLLHGPALPTATLTSFLWFSNMFGYYGLGLWMPELAARYKSFESTNRSAQISVCELSQMPIDLNSPTCATSVDPSVFVNTLISGGFLVLGNVAAALLDSHLPRRFLPVSLMLGAASCVISLFLVKASEQYLIVTTIFQLCIGTANLVQNAIVVDIFPPEVSGMAVCITVMMGRVGAMISNIVLGQLLDVSCKVPILLSSFFIAAGGFVSVLIPRPYNEMLAKSATTSHISA